MILNLTQHSALVLEAVELADGKEKRQQAAWYQEEAFLRWLES